MKSLAIIGAGVAGLMAARTLRATRPDITVTIYEKSRGLGGRVATRRRDAFAFDHGAQVIKAPTPDIARLLEAELPAADLRRIELPVWLFDAAGAIAPGDPSLNAETSYYYRDGNNRLGKLLADGLDVRREVRVASLGRRTKGEGPSAADGQWSVVDVAGQEVGSADAVLLTAPAGQSAEIVAKSELDAALKQRLGAELARGTYRRCISLALAYDRPLDRPYYALLNADRAHPISWLALERVKGADRCPPGHSLLIAQMAPGWSRDHWDAPVDTIGPEVAGILSALLGEDLRKPLWCDRQGWRYALPEGSCDFAALNDTHSGLFFAGDYAAGQGRVHLALESGRRAAELVGRALTM